MGIRIVDKANFIADQSFRIAVPGPLQPGMLTAGMSLPWLTDFLACAFPESGKGWWPA